MEISKKLVLWLATVDTRTLFTKDIVIGLALLLFLVISWLLQ